MGFRIELDGMALPTGQELLVQLTPFDELSETPGNLTVGAAAVNVTAVSSSLDYYFTFRNVSTSGQIIGLGIADTVTIANAQILLYPGEQIQLQFVSVSYWAIADAAGGVLRRHCLSTS